MAEVSLRNPNLIGHLFFLTVLQTSQPRLSFGWEVTKFHRLSVIHPFLLDNYFTDCKIYYL